MVLQLACYLVDVPETGSQGAQLFGSKEALEARRACAWVRAARRGEVDRKTVLMIRRAKSEHHWVKLLERKAELATIRAFARRGGGWWWKGGRVWGRRRSWAPPASTRSERDGLCSGRAGPNWKLTSRSASPASFSSGTALRRLAPRERCFFGGRPNQPERSSWVAT